MRTVPGVLAQPFGRPGIAVAERHETMAEQSSGLAYDITYNFRPRSRLQDSNLF